MISVRFRTPLDTRAYKPDEFVILADFILEFFYKGQWHQLIVPRGYITDFASVPWLVQAAPGFEVNGASRRAAVGHDFVYSCAGRIAACTVGADGDLIYLELTRKECDQLLYGGLIASGFSSAQADVFYAGVRAGGWLHWRRRRDGLRNNFDFVPDTYWSTPE